MIARIEALQRLERESFDVVVIGGGIVGAGVALDAASRGYTVALIERNDFASGTSSRSSKMVHGGLRYLQNFDIGLVREALLERQLLVELAPHLVKPMPFIVPAFGDSRKSFKIGVGLNLYDVLSATRFGRARERDSDAWSPSRHRTIDRDELLAHIPALAQRDPNSGYLFYDCQTDDVRLVLSVLGEAERFGAVCVNAATVVRLSEHDGRAVGVVCREQESDEEFAIQATNVVNATGVWADQVRPEELHGEGDLPEIRPSRGTHILISADELPLRSAVIVPAPGGRIIFALPWLGRTLVGTTDNDHDGSLEHPQPDQGDVGYLLDAVNTFFATTFDRSSIVGAFAGVRPLISTGDSRRSVDISRKAELYETSSGMLTITGGKLTTYRRMASMTVDRLVERAGGDRPCLTQAIGIGRPVSGVSLPAVAGVTVEVAESLATRYGEAAKDVLAIAAAEQALAQPIVAGFPDILAEVRFAAQREQARTIGDVLLRRTRLGLLAGRELADADSRIVKAVAKVLGKHHGWSRSREQEARRAWQAEVAAEGIAIEEPLVAA